MVNRARRRRDSRTLDEGRPEPSGFLNDVRCGREFEASEKARWSHISEDHIHFEAPTVLRARRGRVDIKIDEGLDYIAVIEIKATNWDRLAPARLRPTALRHARQIWRYVEDFLDTKGKEVCPALVYQFEPREPGIRKEVEEILNGRLIQVVWRKEHAGGLTTASKRRRAPDAMR